MREIPIKRVDSFTLTPFAGNPAGVIADASAIGEELYLPIAREMAASETAFVLPPTAGAAADIRLRWFTPAAEVPLCGHATVAAFHVLAEEGAHGLAAPGAHSFRMECQAGILAVRVDLPEAGPVSVTLSLPVPRLERITAPAEAMARLLAIEINDFDLSLPPQRSQHYGVFPIRSLRALKAMRPDFDALQQWGRELGLFGFIFFTKETVEPESDVHLRFFAPGVGVAEDPVTGSAHGPLGAYLFRHGLVRGEGPLVYAAEQGDGLHRPGRLRVTLDARAGAISCISITGQAVTVFSGALLLP